MESTPEPQAEPVKTGTGADTPLADLAEANKVEEVEVTEETTAEDVKTGTGADVPLDELATGGVIENPGAHLVGEDGPELTNVPEGASVDAPAANPQPEQETDTDA